MKSIAVFWIPWRTDMAPGLGSLARQCKIIVVIPAHNEELTLSKTLLGLYKQRSMMDTTLEHSLYEVLVLCHNCTDGTYSVCEDFIRTHPHFNLRFLKVDNPLVNNVGAVRRILMRWASQRLLDDNGYIANTDAGTVVDRYWIANFLGYVGSGYGLVCGLIKVGMDQIRGNAKRTLLHKQGYFKLRTRLEHEICPDAKNPWPRHAHNWGPNMAIRKDVYHSIGGIPPKGF